MRKAAAALAIGLVAGLLVAGGTDEKHVSPDQRARFWRATAELNQAQAARNSAIVEMERYCGTPLVFDASGEPDCQKKEQPKEDRKK